MPSGPDGPDPDELARAFEESGARLFYAQPNYANPTGAQWPADGGDEVLDVVRRHGAFLVEDDWAHDFGITSHPVPVAARDDSGHVVYLRSLTKSVSPSIRVAALIARGPARERILADRAAESMYVSGLLQAAALDVVTQPGWQTHLRSLRHQLQSRRDLLVTSLREHVPQAHIEQVPKGGLTCGCGCPTGPTLSSSSRTASPPGFSLPRGTNGFRRNPPAPSSGSTTRARIRAPSPRAPGLLGRCSERNQA